MTGLLDGVLVPITADLIGQLGAACTYTVVTEGNYDPTTGKTSMTDTDYPVSAVVDGLKVRASGAAKLELTNIVRIQVLIAASAIPNAPTIGDRLLVPGLGRFTTFAPPIPQLSGAQVAAWELWMEAV